MKMMKMMTGSLAIAALALTTSCEQEEVGSNSNAQFASILNVETDGTSSIIHSYAMYAYLETPALTETELAVLLKMKNEEKLARDVYSALYDKWGVIAFSKITNAENNHLNAIVNLLAYYDAADTLIGNASVYEDSVIQSLYSILLSQGSVSQVDAYKTGTLIEEMDINDLKSALTSTTNANIIMVFENLERGSRNHLRAFNRQLTNIGETYTPQYLTQDEYTTIVNAPMEKGKQYKMNGKNNGKGNHKGKMQGRGNGKGNGGNGQMQGDGSCNN
jgi:hypothetical protein